MININLSALHVHVCMFILLYVRVLFYLGDRQREIPERVKDSGAETTVTAGQRALQLAYKQVFSGKEDVRKHTITMKVLLWVPKCILGLKKLSSFTLAYTCFTSIIKQSKRN